MQLVVFESKGKIFKMFFKYFIFFCIISINCGVNANNLTIRSFDENSSSHVLSRTKRFLIFPDGSSFQLVFCCQQAAVIDIGDIFLYSSTAALAWNLPTDSKFLQMFKQYEKTAQRRGDEKSIYYVDENGKFLGRIPYKRPTIVNPAFAKRSVNDPVTLKDKMKINRVKMHAIQSKRNFLDKEQMDDDSVEFHRNNRVQIYEKIMPLITALGGDGRQCVLYKLCEAGRISKQGTFQEELLRVVFTLPKGKEFEDESHKDFDKAHTASDDCAKLYPGCNIGVSYH